MGNEFQNTLMHHGIKGQKWGVRNGPPYPLEGDKRGSNNKGSATILAALAIQTLLAVTPIVISDIRQRREPKRIEKYAQKALDNQNSKKYSNERENEKLDEESGLYLKNKDLTIDEDMERINPNYKISPAFQVNCTACTVAMELRQRGFDVAAGTDQSDWLKTGGTMEEERQKWYKDKDYMSTEDYMKTAMKSRDDFLNKLSGDISKNKTARGEILVDWRMGGGHSMYYTNNNGNITIYDAQSNKKYSGDEIKKIINPQSVALMNYVRLDNKKFDYDYLKKNNIIN